jgi:glucosamine--fructose-6-phosphate aminotransferase (isomerizing)
MMPTLMQQEALQSADVVAQILASDGTHYAKWAQQVLAYQPAQVVTIARGSSDHAVSYIAYLLTLVTGKVVASLPMSQVSLYQAMLDVKNTLAIAVSQSGRSPDLLAALQSLQAQGAMTTSLVNDQQSPLAATTQWTFGLQAGVEKSVAATKSFIASLAVGARLVGTWEKESHGASALLRALDSLPEALVAASRLDWSVAVDIFQHTDRAMVLGRGLGLSIAQEAALKLKETSGLQAEAFSGAEVIHGPMALVGEDYPLLVFALPGPALAGQLALAYDMRQRGARVVLVGCAGEAPVDVALPPIRHHALGPLVAIQAFYMFANALALARGLNPDTPKHLKKVTLTV